MIESDQSRTLNNWLRAEKHRAILFKVVRAYAFTLEDQDDLFQEVAVQIWRSIPAFKGNSMVSTWIYKIALNTALKWQRDERKHYSGRESIGHTPFVLRDNVHVQDERLVWLYETIAKLDKVDRSIALLMLDGFSYKEIAGLLGVTENHVGVKINRIKNQLIKASKKLV